MDGLEKAITAEAADMGDWAAGSGRSLADRAVDGAEGAGRASMEMAGKGSGRSGAGTAGEGAE